MKEQKNMMVGEQLSKSACGFEVIGAAISVGVLGFWFGIGVVLGVKVVNSLGRACNQIIKWQKNKKSHKK